MRKAIGSLCCWPGWSPISPSPPSWATASPQEHWAWKLLYFPIVGMAWVLPLKPLLRWMHAKDGPRESPDV